MTKRLGDSSVQREIEQYVIDRINRIGVGSIESGTELNTDRIILNEKKFEVDFHQPKKTLGEIYACKFNLQSAQKKKVQGDLLKMITIEKHWKKKDVSKLFIMALSCHEPELNHIPKSKRGTFIVAKDSKHYINTLGENSWIWKTIEDFGFEIYYILLPENLSTALEEQRSRQRSALEK